MGVVVWYLRHLEQLVTFFSAFSECSSEDLQSPIPMFSSIAIYKAILNSHSP